MKVKPALVVGLCALLVLLGLLYSSVGRHCLDTTEQTPRDHDLVKSLRLKLGEAEKSLTLQKRVNSHLAMQVAKHQKKEESVGKGNVPPQITDKVDGEDTGSVVPPAPRRDQEYPNGSEETHFTAVLMSYPKSSRFHLLKKIIEYVRRWSIVYEVVLVWNSDNNEPPPSDIVNLASRTDRGAPLRILPQKTNVVDNRWKIVDDIRTNAVLNLDDDVNLTRSGADCLFSVWKQSPYSAVGVDVRSHKPRPPDATFNVGPWSYGARDLTDGIKKYSIMLPRALMTHRDHYGLYKTAQQNPVMRKIVDDLRCDDIAFNYVVSNATGLAPVYVKAQYRPFPESHSKDAMFNQPMMKKKRQLCVNELTKHFGKMALQHRYWHVLCSVDG